MSHHGEVSSDIISPRSRFYHGPYGRMFRNLPPYRPEGDDPIKKLETLAKTMVELELQARDPARDNDSIPAGYTYFGQFVDHDITYDPTSSLIRFNDPDKLRNFRTPRFDLDSLYGSGPDDSPFLYDKEEFGKLLEGERFEIKVKRQNKIKAIKAIEELQLSDEIVGKKMMEDDLPRNSQGRALIGDARNDENIIISQIQLGFIKFHNAVIDYIKNEEGITDNRRAFPIAQRLVRWHYQWVVLHDYLVKIAGHAIVNSILPQPNYPRKFNLHFYRWRKQPFIPVEFSVAAFRFGHSMIRGKYDLSFHVQNRPIFSFRRGTPLEKDDLRGFRHLPKFWTLQWDLFLKIEASNPQKSRRIDPFLTWRLQKLPGNINGPKHPSPICVFDEVEPERPNLVCLDLVRGFRMALPSGQSVAKAMGQKPLEGEEEPLWKYILREADELEDGQKLGPVGGRIVAEVIIGLLAGDPNSFLNIEPNWQPVLPSEGAKFELRDIFRFAGVPLTEQHLRNLGIGVEENG